jgi:Tol biopolymer transport system component
MKKVIEIVTVLMVLGLATQVTNADYVFGIPENLGSTVNSSAMDGVPSMSADGLELFFNSNRAGGVGEFDLWVTMRPTLEDSWEEPINLGSIVNTTDHDSAPFISPDGLSLYFESTRPGGYGGWDIWVTTRATRADEWSKPINLGPPINTSTDDRSGSISPDGLTFFFSSSRTGGSGSTDLWISTRDTTNDPWGEPVNLGSTVNSSSVEDWPSISSDGRMLLFMSNRASGYGFFDIWMITRSTADDEWSTPVNLGSTMNTSDFDGTASVSSDGSTLLFMSGRSGGIGSFDIWQASIDPVVDLNSDGIVDSIDMCIIVDNWGTDNPLCDIGPMPWGDGVVDVEDLIVLAEHLFEEFPLADSIE